MAQARWAWPSSNSSSILKAPRGSAAGAVRSCARGDRPEVPCGFLPGQTRLRAPVDCHLRRPPQAALTLAHCSSSCWQFTGSCSHPCSRQPQQSCIPALQQSMYTLSRSWVQYCHPCWCPRVKDLPYFRDMPSSMVGMGPKEHVVKRLFK